MDYSVPIADLQFQHDSMLHATTDQYPLCSIQADQQTGLIMPNDDFQISGGFFSSQQPFQTSSSRCQTSTSAQSNHFDQNIRQTQLQQYNQQFQTTFQQNQKHGQYKYQQQHEQQALISAGFFQQSQQQHQEQNGKILTGQQFISVQNQESLTYSQPQSNNLLYSAPPNGFSSYHETSQQISLNPFQQPQNPINTQTNYQNIYLQQKEVSFPNEELTPMSLQVDINEKTDNNNNSNHSSNNNSSSSKSNSESLHNQIGLEQTKYFSGNGEQIQREESSALTAPVAQQATLPSLGLPIKRGRGRPRKYPLLEQGISQPLQQLQNPGELDQDGNPIVGTEANQDPAEAARIAALMKKQLEAEQRRKYKEILKLQSLEMKSKESEESEYSGSKEPKLTNIKKKPDLMVSDDPEFTEKVIGRGNAEFLRHYKQKIIGRSSNSKIFELRDSITDIPIGQVVKQVPHKISNLHQSECCELRNEFNFLSKMSHPRIISLGSTKEFIRDRNFCGIVLPQARSNLMQFAKTQRHGKILLAHVRIALRHVAEAVLYLHEHYISHNDIKPDNIFVFGDDDYRLADFGFAIELPKPNAFKHNTELSQTLRKQVKIEDLKKNWKLRCKQYVAPELIKLLGGKRPRSASDEKACDVFALGVTFFIIVFYQLPFGGCALKKDQRYKHFFNGNHEKFWCQFHSMFAKFNQQENAHTDELRDLLNQMLEPDPHKRITIQQILDHPWVNH